MSDTYECMNCGVEVDADQAGWILCHDELGRSCRRKPEPSPARRPTTAEQDPVYRQQMRDAGRGHLLPW